MLNITHLNIINVLYEEILKYIIIGTTAFLTDVNIKNES